MRLMGSIKGEFIDVIECIDDARDTLAYRFPSEDKASKNGAQLIVCESQAVQLMCLGQFGDTFALGKHPLTTDNTPVLPKLKSWKYLCNSPFKADVFYVTTQLFTGNKWGTANPVMVRDDDFGLVHLRAFGTFGFKTVNPSLFTREVAGSAHHFRLDDFADTMRSRMVSVFSEALASSKMPVLDVATRYAELGEALLPMINPVAGAKCGLEIGSFLIEHVSVPLEVETAIDEQSSMAAIGHLNDYVKYQMGQGMAWRTDTPDTSRVSIRRVSGRSRFSCSPRWSCCWSSSPRSSDTRAAALRPRPHGVRRVQRPIGLRRRSGGRVRWPWPGRHQAADAPRPCAHRRRC